MNKDETFMEKILNSPLFVVVLVSSYSIVSLFMVLFFDSFLAFGYFTNAIKTKIFFESLIALLCGLFYGIDNEKSKNFKYFLFLFLLFFVLHFFIMTILILKTGVSDNLSFFAVKETFNTVRCMAASIFYTFSFCLSYLTVFDFKNIFNCANITNKHIRGNIFSDMILKTLNTPFCIAFVIFSLSVIISVFKVFCDNINFDIVSIEKCKSDIECILILASGVIYGVYNKKVPDARFLFVFFLFFVFVETLTILFLCTNFSDAFIYNDLKYKFYNPFSYVINFCIVAYLANFKKYKSNTTAIKNENKDIDKNKIKIASTPLKTVFYITLLGNALCFLDRIHALLLLPSIEAEYNNTFFGRAALFSFLLDFIIAFFCGIYYGLLQVKIIKIEDLIKTCIVCSAILIIRCFLSPTIFSLLTTPFFGGYLFIGLPFMASWVIGTFVITNHITYGIKNR